MIQMASFLVLVDPNAPTIERTMKWSKSKENVSSLRRTLQRKEDMSMHMKSFDRGTYFAIRPFLHRLWRNSLCLSQICLLTLFLTFLPFVGNVTAADGFEVTGTVSIEPGYCCKLPFVMATDGVFEFGIEVRSGPDIDVILIPYSDLNDYQNGDSFTHYPDGTFSGCDETEGDVYLYSGTYCLILSNDGSSTASVHYSYTPTPLQGDSDDEGLSASLSSTTMIVLIGIILLAAAGILILKIKVPMGRSPDAPSGGTFCKECGEPILSDSSYCRKCGGRVK